MKKEQVTPDDGADTAPVLTMDSLELKDEVLITKRRMQRQYAIEKRRN